MRDHVETKVIEGLDGRVFLSKMQLKKGSRKRCLLQTLPITYFQARTWQLCPIVLGYTDTSNKNKKEPKRHTPAAYIPTPSIL